MRLKAPCMVQSGTVHAHLNLMSTCAEDACSNAWPFTSSTLAYRTQSAPVRGRNAQLWWKDCLTREAFCRRPVKDNEYLSRGTVPGVALHIPHPHSGAVKSKESWFSSPFAQCLIADCPYRVSLECPTAEYPSSARITLTLYSPYTPGLYKALYNPCINSLSRPYVGLINPYKLCKRPYADLIQGVELLCSQEIG